MSSAQVTTSHIHPRNKTVHIVLFKYAKSANDDAKLKVASSFEALKSKCVSPETGDPYILSLDAGVNYSQEGHDHGFEHGFVVTFRNEQDRDYYLWKDPAHDEFKKLVSGVVEDITVCDFVPGIF